MSHHRHEHHDHIGHAHGARRGAPASLLRASAAGRLGAACLAIAAVWAGVFWAMS